MTKIGTEPANSNEDNEPVSLGKRLLMGLGVFVLLGGGGALFFISGLLLATFATDSCQNIPDWTNYYLGAWPIMLGLIAIIPPILVVANVRWRWVILVAVIGMVISIVWLIGWFPIIISIC